LSYLVHTQTDKQSPAKNIKNITSLAEIMNKKTSINSIYLNLWASTASLLQGLTVMQQCVYQIKFRNVCEVKKQLVQPGLVWSRTLSILLSMNIESASLPLFA